MMQINPPNDGFQGCDAGSRADAAALLGALPEPGEATLEEHAWRDTKRWLAVNGPSEGHEGGIELARSVFVREPFPPAVVAELADHHAAGVAEGLACELDLSGKPGCSVGFRERHDHARHHHDGHEHGVLGLSAHRRRWMGRLKYYTVLEHDGQ